MDIGLLIIRIVVGALFIGHGTQKLFGWFGDRGLEGTGGFFASLGYRPPTVMAGLAGIAEAGGGLLLALGFVTPLAAAAIVGVMTSAALAVHARHGLWNTQGGFELPLVDATVVTAVAFIGPGRFSLDHLLGWNLAGVPWGVGAFALGFLSASALNQWRAAPAPRAVPAPEASDERKAA